MDQDGEVEGVEGLTLLPGGAWALVHQDTAAGTLALEAGWLVGADERRVSRAVYKASEQLCRGSAATCRARF